MFMLCKNNEVNVIIGICQHMTQTKIFYAPSPHTLVDISFQQEMLTRSGAPDFICFPFGWQIHFAMSILRLFGPYWLSVKVLCWNACFSPFYI